MEREMCGYLEWNLKPESDELVAVEAEVMHSFGEESRNENSSAGVEETKGDRSSQSEKSEHEVSVLVLIEMRGILSRISLTCV